MHTGSLPPFKAGVIKLVVADASTVGFRDFKVLGVGDHLVDAQVFPPESAGIACLSWSVLHRGQLARARCHNGRWDRRNPKKSDDFFDFGHVDGRTIWLPGIPRLLNE